jgi:hypothetical protein
MRTIRRQPGFDDAAQRIAGSIELADLALQGMEWVLARLRKEHLDNLPVIGTFATNVLYAYKTQPFGSHGTPIVVYFTCDDSFVTLYGIRESAVTVDDE